MSELSVKKSKTAELIAVISTICSFSFCIGFIYPVIALSMEAQGFDETAIGLNGLASGLGILVAGFAIPRAIGRFGTFNVVLMSTIITLISLTFFPIFQGATEWFVLRFFLGVGVAGLFSVGEAWINSIADNASRGRTIAIYVAAMALSFAGGAATVSVTGYEGWTPFLTAMIIVGACLLPVLPFRFSDPLIDAEEEKTDHDVMLIVFRQALILMLVVALFGLLDGAVLALLPSYALSNGVPEHLGSLPLAFMAGGVVFFQAPIGFLADRMSRIRLLTIILFLVAVLGIMVPEVDLTHWSGLLFLAIFGGLSFAPYTLAMSILGERYRGPKLAAGSALFAIMWGVGGTIGPGSFGFAMETLGSYALPYGIALLFFLTAIMSLWDRSQPGALDAQSTGTLPD